MVAGFFYLLHHIFENLFLLTSLALIYGLVFPLIKKQLPAADRILSAIIFILAAFFSFAFPVDAFGYMSIDARLIPVSLASAFGGPWAGLATALSAALMELAVSGLDGLPYLTAYALAPVLSIVILRWARSRSWRRGLMYGVLGLAMAILLIPAGLIRYPDLSAGEGIVFGLAVLLVFPAGASLLGLAFDIPRQYKILSSEMRTSRQQYRHLFEYAPVALWEEDYSEAARYVWENPELIEEEHISAVLDHIQEYFSKIRIITMNHRAVQLAGASDKRELRERLSETFLPSVTANSFVPELRALRDRKTSSLTYSEIQNLQGLHQYVQIHWNVLPDHRDDYKRVIVSIIDTTEIIDQANRLQESVQHQEMLIKEIHHRVRNSLSIAYSILGMQKLKLDSPEKRRIISDTQNRIQTISLIHTRLYRNRTILAVDIRNYLQELAKMLRHQDDGEFSSLEVDSEALSMHIDQALPLGLLTGELLSAAICRAFGLGSGPPASEADPGLNGKLSLKRGDDCYRFTLVAQHWAKTPESGDEGIFPEESLRALLVPSLAEQLHAEAEMSYDAEGFRFELRIPLQEVEWPESAQ
jgi:two-component sensor histidine kinase/PAS domain-containing protein